MQFLILLGIIHLYFTRIFANENLIVSLKDGLVKGSYMKSYNGRKFIAFEGIPFARPPIGSLRFEDPQPVEPWPGVLDAVNNYLCFQIDMLQEVSGQEDCLYLNVYVPREKINLDEKFDVIAHVHGSAFMVAGPFIAGPHKIMDRDVIYVNFNYRLGPFGFFSLGDGRGNYGLKDQTAALKWIQDNIEKFGGNKGSVTLSGLSAGGASVELHMFSDLSKGLFHKAFSQSGTGLNPWAIRTNPERNGKRIAADVGCSDQSIKGVYECLKQRSGRQIAASIKNSYHTQFLPLVPFGPVVEKNSPTSFLKKLPHTQLIAKEVIDVPYLISMTTDEGTTPTTTTYNIVDEINSNYKIWFPLLLEYYEYAQDKRDDISTKIREFYFGNEPITTENYHILVKMCTERLFHLEAEKAAKWHAKASKSNIYFLLMGYVGEFNNFVAGGADVNLGAGHGMDMKFFYTGPYPGGSNLTKDEEKMKDVLLDMMVSFAKTGNPNTDAVHMEPVSDKDDFKYLLIEGLNDQHMQTTRGLGPHEFWSSLGLGVDENAI